MTHYCKLAKVLYKENIECGQSCPIIAECPKLILEDAADLSSVILEKLIIKYLKNVDKNG